MLWHLLVTVLEHKRFQIMNLKKTSLVLVSLLYTALLTAQRQYDYYDDSAVAGGADRAFNGLVIEVLLVIGVFVLLLLGGLYFKIYYWFKPDANPKNILQKANGFKETQKKVSVVDSGFICPFCGKPILDNNFRTMTRVLDGNVYDIKCCRNCSDKYYRYREADEKYQRSSQQEMPNWLYLIIIAISIGFGLYVLIFNCMRDEVLLGIIGMIVGAIFVGIAITAVIGLFVKLFERPKPIEPFKTPSLEHIIECKALERKK